jgi:hypothetical protein
MFIHIDDRTDEGITCNWRLEPNTYVSSGRTWLIGVWVGKTRNRSIDILNGKINE